MIELNLKTLAELVTSLPSYLQHYSFLVIGRPTPVQSIYLFPTIMFSLPLVYSDEYHNFLWIDENKLPDKEALKKIFSKFGLKIEQKIFVFHHHIIETPLLKNDEIEYYRFSFTPFLSQCFYHYDIRLLRNLVERRFHNKVYLIKHSKFDNEKFDLNEVIKKYWFYSCLENARYEFDKESEIIYRSVSFLSRKNYFETFKIPSLFKDNIFIKTLSEELDYSFNQKVLE